MEFSLLYLLVIIFALAIGVVVLFHRLRIPAVIGFLLTGILVGPYGLHLAQSADVTLLADIGVVLLLFTVGIEFSVQGLRRVKRSFLLGGSLQVFLTTGIVAAIAMNLGLSMQQSIFIGFLVALSSTAIIMKLLQDRGEVDSPHGQIVIAVSIFQDLIAVLLMLFIPMLAGKSGMDTALLFSLGKGLAVLAVVMIGAFWLVPRLLHLVAGTRNTQVFLLAIVVICGVVAWLSQAVGLSLALGAFLAGLILAESEYGNQALANILPFRDMFMSLFFISIGMLLNLTVFLDHPLLIVVLALGVMVVKVVVATIAASLLGMPIRVAVLVGFALASMSEFAFVLAAAARDSGLITALMLDQWLVVAVLTMAIAPLALALSPRVAQSLTLIHSFNDRQLPAQKQKRLRDHLIIVGMGVNGEHVKQAAVANKIPYIIIDMNPTRVRKQREKGENILFGDATTAVVLEEAGVQAASAMVVAIADLVATRGIIAATKRVNPAITVISRASYCEEEPLLRSAGADQIVTSEYQASLELCRKVLDKYGVSHGRMNEFFNTIGAKRDRDAKR